MRRLILPVFLILSIIVFSLFPLTPGSKLINNTEAAIPYAEWEAGGRLVQDNADEAWSAAITQAPDGNLVVIHDYFFSGQGYQTFIQKYDQNGDEMWTPGGIAIGSPVGMSFSDDHLFYNSLGELIWVGQEFGGSWDGFMQKFAADGTPLYPSPIKILDSVKISYQHDLRVTPDLQGGFYVTWIEEGDMGVYAQHVDKDGNLLWSTTGSIPGILLTSGMSHAGGFYRDSHLMPDGSIVFIHQRFTSIYFFKYNYNGTSAIAPSPKSLFLGINGNYMSSAVDDQGDIYLVRNISEELALLKFDSNGDTVWGSSGVVFGTRDNNYFDKLMVDNNGGVYALWSKYVDFDYGYADAYAQKISTDGVVLWNPSGLQVFDNMEYHDENAFMIYDENGGLFVFSDPLDGTTPDDNNDRKIFVQYISPDGRIARKIGEIEATAAGYEDLWGARNTNSDSIILFWTESGTSDVRAQSYKIKHQIKNLPVKVDAQTSLFENIELEGASSTVENPNTESFNLTDSPGMFDYESDSYTELGWTTFTTSMGFIAPRVEIQMDVTVDSYPEESRIYIESPAGEQAIVLSAPSFSSTTESVSVVVNMSQDVNAGQWKFWVGDSYGDGGTSAANVAITVSDGGGGSPYDTTGLDGTDNDIWLYDAPRGCHLGQVKGVDMTIDRDWSGYAGGCSIAASHAFSKGHTNLPGKNGHFKFLVPKGNGHDAVKFCPGADAENELTTSCAGGVTKDASFADVEVVTVDTQEYWEIDNPVDGGGVSFVLADEGETPPDPGDPPPVDPPVDPPPWSRCRE